MKRISVFFSRLVCVCLLFFAFMSNEANAERIKKPHRFNNIYRQILEDTEYLSLGNQFSKNIIIDFFDYRCKYCQQFHKQMFQALEAGKLKNIRWIIIEAPIFGDDTNQIARHVLAAKEQGKYKEMFLEVAKRGDVPLYQLESIAKDLGLNVELLKMDAYTDRVTDVFKKNMKLYKKFKVNSVPLIIADKKVHKGAILGEKLDDLLEDLAD